MSTAGNPTGVAAINAAKTHCLRGHPFDAGRPGERRCSICRREREHPGSKPRVVRTIEEKFHAKVGPPNASGCREWIGARNPYRGGYGIFWVSKGATVLAHRMAWELAYGPIPDGLLVCHRCDNPPCCEPSHFFLGTDADNARDKVSKGRHRAT